MKKSLVILTLTLSCILIGGCGMDHKIVEDTINKLKEESKYKDVEVHTEEEMKDYALLRLKEKYNKEFEFEEDLRYRPENDDIMCLNGHAHVIGDEELRCYFGVTEPNQFRDNYASNYYKEDIKKYLEPTLKNISSEYEISVGYDINSKVFDPEMDFKKYLYNDKCEIYYTAYVKEVSDYHQYIPIIREWMEVLYKADYKWYFELHDIDDKDKYYFTLDPGDNGFNSPEDWKDELIYKYILSRLEFQELDKEYNMSKMD